MTKFSINEIRSNENNTNNGNNNIEDNNNNQGPGMMNTGNQVVISSSSSLRNPSSLSNTISSLASSSSSPPSSSTSNHNSTTTQSSSQQLVNHNNNNNHINNNNKHQSSNSQQQPQQQQNNKSNLNYVDSMPSIYPSNTTTSSSTTTFLGFNWRDEADGSEEDQMIRGFAPLLLSSTTTSAPTVTISSNRLPSLFDSINSSSNFQMLPNSSSSTNGYDCGGEAAPQQKHSNTNPRFQFTSSTNRTNQMNPRMNQQAESSQEFDLYRMFDLMHSLDFLNTKNNKDNHKNQNHPQNDKTLNDKTSNINNFYPQPSSSSSNMFNRHVMMTANDGSHQQPSTLRFMIRNNNNHTGNKNRKLINNQLYNNCQHQPSNINQPSTSVKHRHHQPIPQYQHEQQPQEHNQHSFEPYMVFNHSFRRDLDSIIDSNNVNHVDDEMHFVENDLDSCGLPTPPSMATNNNDSNAMLNMNYFKQINQQVYHLLMVQSHQIQQQHQLIGQWIQCQQEWLKRIPLMPPPPPTTPNSTPIATNSSSRMMQNNCNNNMINMMNDDHPTTVPDLHLSSRISDLPQTTSTTTTLNNQTVPAVRVNNFWDNFRSQSGSFHQNKLRQQSSQPTPTTTGIARDFLMQTRNCNNQTTCQDVCSKNWRSHSFHGFTNHPTTNNNKPPAAGTSDFLINNIKSIHSRNLQNYTRNLNQQNMEPTTTTTRNQKDLSQLANKMLSIMEKFNLSLMPINNNETLNHQVSSSMPSTETSNFGLNGLKRKKINMESSVVASSSSVNNANNNNNLVDLREEACECDIGDVSAGDGVDLLDDDDDDDQTEDDHQPPPQHHVRHLHHRSPSSSNNNENIRPLMPAEGRSSEPSAPTTTNNQSGSNGAASTSTKSVVTSSSSASTSGTSTSMNGVVGNNKSTSSGTSNDVQQRSNSGTEDNGQRQSLLLNDLNNRSDDHNDDEADDKDDDEEEEEDQSGQNAQNHRHRAVVLPMVLPNGNANEVRSSVRLSGDGEQGL